MKGLHKNYYIVQLLGEKAMVMMIKINIIFEAFTAGVITTMWSFRAKRPWSWWYNFFTRRFVYCCGRHLLEV